MRHEVDWSSDRFHEGCSFELNECPGCEIEKLQKDLAAAEVEIKNLKDALSDSTASRKRLIRERDYWKQDSERLESGRSLDTERLDYLSRITSFFPESNANQFRIAWDLRYPLSGYAIANHRRALRDSIDAIRAEGSES